ncbi:MAG: PrgI family protein [Clostridiaceae bacterium]|nr:PrgI family protein [Clostridiaceae bacterium]
MSIEVRIPKEITEYKEKILFGLSLRQLICFAVAIISGVATYYFGSMLLGRDMASYLVIVEVIPVFAIGFIRKNGFPFEKYAALMFRHRFGTHKRHYKTKLEIDSNGKEKQVKGDKKNGAIQKANTKADKNKRECQVFEVGEKSRKRKSKETYREIKAAKQDHKRAKQEAFKAAEKRISSKDSTGNHQV